MNQRLLLVAGLAAAVSAGLASGADWITAPSYYTHDPQTGERVSQYSPIGPFYTYPRPDYVQSGYRHMRSSIQVGRSADHMHIVEEWGRPVRPYGEWRFPFRPYSVPFQLWNSPFAGTQFPWQPFPFSSPNGHRGGPAYGGGPYDRQDPPPYYDGSYPEVDPRRQQGYPPEGMDPRMGDDD